MLRLVRIGGYVLHFAVGVSLLGCSLIFPQPQPERQQYLLQLKDPEGDGPSARHAALRSRVLLETEAAAPYLDSTKILFWHGGNTFGAYQYATWAEPPSDVFGQALLEKISRDGVVADVSEKAGLIAATTLLRARLDEFWLNTTTQPSPQVQARISLVLMDLERRRTIGRSVVSLSADIVSPSAESVSKALSTVGAQLVQRSVVWLYEELDHYELDMENKGMARNKKTR
jgi:ABC-type uncharacterized transport system auxiliary subunit